MKTRNTKEMLELILGVAEKDERIRAVVLNGSRANKCIKKDCFQDYDIVYIVTDIRPFVRDHSWISVFGEPMIVQMPEDWHSHPYDHDSNEPFTYLMQFMDGTRIDLRLIYKLYIDNGEPTVKLLDKDGILPEFSDPTGSIYFVQKPSEKEFTDCCNEFWWTCPYVAKGLWRDELPYSRHVMENLLRSELMKMLDWYVGIKHDFMISTGKWGKYIKQYLSDEEFRLFEHTFPDFEPNSIWNSLFNLNILYRRSAMQVAAYFGYPYPEGDDQRVTDYLRHVRLMPASAKSIY